MTACPIRYQRQVSDRKGKIFYTSITSLSHISKSAGLLITANVRGGLGAGRPTSHFTTFRGAGLRPQLIHATP